MNIFVVEDSLSIRHLLVRRLETMPGVRVIGEAEGETEAGALIDWLQPDTVLLDLSLADGGSGLKVLSRLRAGGFDGRVLVLTHQAMDAYREAAADAGANGFYDKATGLETLFTDLDTIVGEQPKRSTSDQAAVLLRDGLTGLFGEVLLLERLDQAAKIAYRNGNELAVYVLMLDGLSTLADERGAEGVNAVVRAVSDKLREVCEPEDVLARHAADQFSLVLARVDSSQDATAFAGQLAELLGQVFSAVQAPSLRVQVGMALFPAGAVAPRSLLTLAEAHAYGAMLPQRPSVFTY